MEITHTHTHNIVLLTLTADLMKMKKGMKNSSHSLR
jgi:hypothetical protein